MNPTDLSMLAVVEFAVVHLKVKHVVVCGHTSCGGVAATLGNGTLGVLDTWLQPMIALREQHADELEKLEGAEKDVFMSKLNIAAGVNVIRRIPSVIKAVEERGMTVHGTLYHLNTGLLEEVHVDETDSAAKKRVTAFERK